MIDVYDIGITLKINDLVGPELLKLSKQFEKLDVLAMEFSKSLKDIGAEAAGMKALSNATGSFGRHLSKANAQALMLEQNLKSIKAIGMMPGLSGGGSGGGGRGGHGGRLHGGNLHVGPGGFGIGGIGMNMMNEAMVPLAVAGATVYIGHMFYEEAKKLEKAKADFSNMNLSKADNDNVLAKSWDLTNKVHGTVAYENMALIQDLHTATGDLAHALEMSDAYARFKVAAKIQNNGNDVDGLVSDSIKALEHRGDKVLQSPAERDKELRMQSQVDFFTRGTVSPADYFAMSKTGKLAYQLASPEYLYGPAAALISANSGSTAGTMEMTALSSLIGGHMDKKGKDFLQGIGLWNDQVTPEVAAMRKKFGQDPEYQKIVAANGGSLIQPGGLSAENAKLFVEDHNKFVLDVMLPAIRKKYGLNISNEEVATLLSGNLNRSTSNDLSFWVTNQQKVAKDTLGIRKTRDYSAAYDNDMDHTPMGAEEDFGTAWKNFKTEFDRDVLPAVTEMLKDGAAILRTIGGFAAKFHDFKDSVLPAQKESDLVHIPKWLSYIMPNGLMLELGAGIVNRFSQSKTDGVLPKNSGGDAPVQPINIWLDGRKLSNGIAPHMAGALGSGYYGGQIDPNVSLPMPALK